MSKLLEQCSSDERNGAKVVGVAQPMEEGVIFWKEVIKFSTKIILKCIRWQQARMVNASALKVHKSKGNCSSLQFINNQWKRYTRENPLIAPAKTNKI